MNHLLPCAGIKAPRYELEHQGLPRLSLRSARIAATPRGNATPHQVRVALESGKTWDVLLPDTRFRGRSLARLDGERYCIANNFPTADSYCAQNYADCPEK